MKVQPKSIYKGESDHLNAIRVDACAKAAKENHEHVVGIKVSFVSCW